MIEAYFREINPSYKIKFIKETRPMELPEFYINLLVNLIIQFYN